jgi:hypothetical protein
MPLDLWTKIALTVIAVSLAMIAWKLPFLPMLGTLKSGPAGPPARRRVTSRSKFRSQTRKIFIDGLSWCDQGKTGATPLDKIPLTLFDDTNSAQHPRLY